MYVCMISYIHTHIRTYICIINNKICEGCRSAGIMWYRPRTGLRLEYHKNRCAIAIFSYQLIHTYIHRYMNTIHSYMYNIHTCTLYNIHTYMLMLNGWKQNVSYYAFVTAIVKKFPLMFKIITTYNRRVVFFRIIDFKLILNNEINITILEISSKPD